MLIEEYFVLIDQWMTQTRYIVNISLVKEKRSRHIGFITGAIEFADGSSLHVMEFVEVKDFIDRYKYRYHYQDRQQERLFRYDMAPHFPGLATSPHHKHLGPAATPNHVIPSSGPLLSEVLAEIEQLLTP
jgi:hypothetical protein